MKYSSKFPLLMFVILSIFSNPVFSTENLVSEKRIQQRIKTIDDAKDMDEQAKTNLLGIYTLILDHLDSINTNNQQSEKFKAARKQAPEDVKQLEAKLSKYEQVKLVPQPQKSSEQVLAEIRNISLAELDHEFDSESANLAAVIAKKSDLKQSLNNERNSSDSIRKRIVEANRLLEQHQEDKKTPLSDGNVDTNKAEQWLVDAQIESLRSEIKMLDLQLLSQPSRQQLLKLKVELYEHNIDKIEISIAQLKQQADLKRSYEIQKTQETTRTELSEAQGKHSLIESLAQKNAKLSDAITQISQDMIKLETNDDIVFKETQRLQDERVSITKKLEIAGLNQILGKILWKQRKSLPDSQQYQVYLDKRESKIAQFGLDNIYHQEELVRIKDKSDYLANLLLEVPAETASLIQDDLIELIDTRKRLLKKVIAISDKYLNAMAELDFSEKKLIDIAISYAQFIDERLFWLRSASVLNQNSFEDAPEQIRALLDPSQWLGFISDTFNMRQSSPRIILGVLLLVFLMTKRSNIKKSLVEVGLKTKKISTDSLLHTWKAIFYTSLLAIPVPMLFWISGSQLANTAGVSAFSYAVAGGMLIIVFPLFNLLAFREMSLSGGIFDIHFKWSTDLTKGIRIEMRRLMLTFIPVIFFMGLLFSATDGSSLNSGLGRLLLLLTLATFALFLYHLLKAKTGILTLFSKSGSQSFFTRFHALLLFIGLTMIAVLMGMTIFGYVYTAGQLTKLLIDSIWLIFAMVILQQTSVRWLLLTRRRYALKKAYEKRQEKQAEEQSEQDDLHAVDTDVIELEEPEIDIISLSEDTQKLLHMGLFILAIFGFLYIWADVLPALGVFEQITLWHHKGVVDGTMKLLPVTLADLGLAILVFVLTLVGAKRLPAIVEILLIQNNKISSGGRYTATTITNYIVLGVGFFAVFNILGAEWDRFQWLFAALSVGIGFGLQEIVANFISGLIILFERPIRVGDLVSVGENEGMVTRIQIRATTIRTYDRKELLVPNKEFITGQLINLSLSDATARMIIPIGVAYGSDIPAARRLLLEAAVECDRVLHDPTPTVMFKSFGDNSLNLELRCFVANVDNRVSIMSEVNEVINEKFNAAEISISFPQRDVHLDISQPIDIRLQGKTE